MLLFGAGVIVVIALLSSNKPRPGLAILGPPLLISNQFQLVLSNRSDVGISYGITSPQFRVGDVWDKERISMKYQVMTNGQLVLWMSEKVSAGSAVIPMGKEPKYIDAPYDVNGWRVGVVWHFDQQTTWEKWHYQLQTKVMGKAPYNLPLLHTNYSSIVPFGNGKADEGKPLLP